AATAYYFNTVISLHSTYRYRATLVAYKKAKLSGCLRHCLPTACCDSTSATLLNISIMDPSNYEEGYRGFYSSVEVIRSGGDTGNTFGVIMGGILILVALLVVGVGIWYLVCRIKNKHRQEPACIRREEGEELLDIPRRPYILETDAQQLV
ncbi:hypothetical protein TYRP_014147, partial [Tyrophagus putrescentiae]